jgi:hypothetical protein
LRSADQETRLIRFLDFGADKPETEIFRRLVDATRKMMGALGSRIVKAGELAGAVAKVGDLMRHL